MSKLHAQCHDHDKREKEEKEAWSNSKIERQSEYLSWSRLGVTATLLGCFPHPELSRVPAQKYVIPPSLPPASPPQTHSYSRSFPQSLFLIMAIGNYNLLVIYILVHIYATETRDWVYHDDDEFLNLHLPTIPSPPGSPSLPAGDPHTLMWR